MRSATCLLVLALTSFGCKRNKPSAQSDGVTPAAPASTAEVDALWAMAPEGAAFGVVISPRAVGMAEHAWQDVRALFAVAPELAVPNSLLSNEIASVFGKPDVVLADVGLSPSKGAAFFVLGDGGGLAIIPVVDRDKFLAATKGTKGTDGDSVGKATCKTLKDVYVCARTPDLFDKIGKSKLKDGLAVTGTRGDVEVVADLPLGPGIKGAAAVQLARGTLVVRAVVGGIPKLVAQTLAQAQTKAPGDRAKTAGFAVMNIAQLLKAAPLTSGKVADMMRSINGPLTLHIPAGTAELDLRLPFSDATAAAELVEHCTDIPGFAEAGASFYDGACHVAVPTLGYTLDIWIENKELRVGKKGGGKASAAVPMTAIGAELADTPAVFSFWGRGTLFGPGPAEMPKLPAVPAEMLMGMRGLSVLSELGMSSRIDGDKLHVTFALRTIWSNPDDVVAKLVAISPQTFLDGKAADAAAAIAAGAPGSPFAADYKAGTGGLMAPAAVVGMLAAVAIPAFMDYMKKSKKSEAELHLNRLAKSAKVHYIESGAFPAGEAPLTPATACCEGPDHRCEAAGAGWMNEAWTKLDFAIDEPTLFQYRYRSDGKTLEAEAIGDLDCDGNAITYKLQMTADQGNPMARIEAPPPNTD